MKRWMGCLIAFACGLVLGVFSILYQIPSKADGMKEWLRVLSNGALVPGVLFSGISLLAWISGDGLFDAVRYTVSSMVAQFRGEKKQYATYYDYLRREKKRNAFNPLLLPGVFFLACAIILTLIYYV